VNIFIFLTLLIFSFQDAHCQTLIKREGLPVCYYDHKKFDNFGDCLSLKLVERIVGEPVIAYRKGVHKRIKKLLAIGSIIMMAGNNDIIWGSGVNGKDLDLKLYKFDQLDIRAIRGPLSRQFLIEKLNITCPEVYGDPALLMPFFFPEFVKKENPARDYIVIPHYSENLFFPESSYPEVVYTSDPWDEIIEKILDSKLVVASSLHGIVVAEAYGIPARLLRVTKNEPMFKYQDYYSGTGRPDFKYASSVEEALVLGGESPPVCDLQKLYESFPIEYWPHKSATRLEDIKDPTSCYIPFENLIGEYVLKSKEIRFSAFPGAFNPSIVRWKDEFLLSFRIRDPLTNSTYRIGLVQLDKNFNVQGPVSEIMMPRISPNQLVREQDPRLIVIGEKLFMVYNTSINGISVKETRRVFVGEVLFDNDQFFIGSIEGPLSFPGEKEMRQEKNWVPFEYNGELLFAYSLDPHRILKPIFGSNACIDYSSSRVPIKWDYGPLRGGTQAYLIGDRYLSFFHSSKSITRPNGEKLTYYFMGAYTFSAEPPFEIMEVSPHPIVGPDFYVGPPYKTWKPLRVVFPCGFVFDDQYIWVACGKQDHEIWIYKLDRNGLLGSLVPVNKN